MSPLHLIASELLSISIQQTHTHIMSNVLFYILFLHHDVRSVYKIHCTLVHINSLLLLKVQWHSIIWAYYNLLKLINICVVFILISIMNTVLKLLISLQINVFIIPGGITIRETTDHDI